MIKKLNIDTFSIILNKLEINDLNKIECINKEHLHILHQYIKIKYNMNYKIFKNFFYFNYTKINLLNNLLNKNKLLLNNINHYLYNFNILDLSYLNKMNNIEYIINYNNNIYINKILYVYFEIFSIILHNLKHTNFLFYDINKYKNYSNINYIYIDIRNTFMNFYKFLLLYNYIKIIIYKKKIL